MPKFILSDESVNRYGFRVLTSGIKLAAFLANPVMFYNHDRSTLPIGKWVNIEVKEGKLIAEPDFDVDDPFAMSVKAKVDKGIINCTSIGFDVQKTSREESLIMPGQTRPTVTECLIFETSFVDIPGNGNAIRMRGVQLSGDFDQEILNFLIPTIQNPKKMIDIAKNLGLAETATESEIVAAIEKIKTESLRLQGNSKRGVEMLIAMAEAKGLKKEIIEKLALADFENTLLMVESTPLIPIVAAVPKPDTERLTDIMLNHKSSHVPVVGAVKFSERLEKDMANLKSEFKQDPVKVALSFRAEFGSDCSLADLTAILG